MSESLNPDWFKGFFSPEKRLRNESLEAYQLRLMDKSDYIFYRAKLNFQRPPYYKRFLQSAQEEQDEQTVAEG